MLVLFMNNPPQAVKCSSINMYADDTALYTASITLGQTIETLSTDAQSTLEWYRKNRFVVNLKKTHFMVLSKKHRKEICDAKLVLDNTEIQL